MSAFLAEPMNMFFFIGMQILLFCGLFKLFHQKTKKPIKRVYTTIWKRHKIALFVCGVIGFAIAIWFIDDPCDLMSVAKQSFLRMVMGLWLTWFFVVVWYEGKYEGHKSGIKHRKMD